MALVTETGTGSAASEAYASVVDADTYHAARGNTVWATLTTPVKEQLLRKATEYMVQVYRSKWNGWRVNLAQALDWPRQGVYLQDYGYPVNGEHYGTYQNLIANNIVPVEVSRACMDLALTASSGPLAPNIERLESSVSIGPLSVSYAPNAPAFVEYRAIDLLLRPYLDVSSGNRIVRT